MAEEPELFGDDESTPSPFFAALEVAEKALGGRGRPPGARNRKSEAFEKWFGAMGYKDPAQYLAELYGADPIALRTMVPGADMLEILKLQLAAAGELLPYLHGKKPTEVVVTDERLPTLIVVTDTNQLEEARQLLERRQAMLSAGSLLIEGEAVEKPGNAGVSEDGQ